MQAIVMTKMGKRGAVERRELPRPTLEAHEVLVRVHAAGLNPVDLKIMRGEMKVLFRHRLPQTIGSDVAGVVVEVGAKVTRFAVGDEVYAYTGLSKLGAFAEYAAIPESHVALKPKNLSFVEAATIPLVALTLQHALVDIGKTQPGQRVFLRAGSGGTGTFGIQFAKTLGAEVITTTSTANVGWVRALGADRVIDYKTEAFEETVRDCDVVLETMDAASMKRSFGVVRRGGHVVSVGDLPTAAFARELGFNVLVQWIFWLVGLRAMRWAARVGAAYDFFVVSPNGARLAEITPAIERGAIKAVVDRVFPFDRAEEALAYLALGRAKGKIVLELQGSGDATSRD